MLKYHTGLVSEILCARSKQSSALNGLLFIGAYVIYVLTLSLLLSWLVSMQILTTYNVLSKNRR